MPKVDQEDQKNVTVDDPIEDKKSDLEKVGKDELIDIIRSTRSEAKKYRLELKKIKDEFEQIQSEKEKTSQQKKIDEGKKDEVIADLQKQIEQLKPEAEEYKTYKLTKREILKQRLGDKWLDSMNNLSISDLEVLTEKLIVAPKAVDIVFGNGNSPGSEPLTGDEKVRAKEMGLSDEGFMQFKKTQEKLKR